METIDAVAALAALAQETRLEVFRLLVRIGPAGLPAGQIGSRLNLPPATLSFHLTQLRQAGLVINHRNGRSLVYSADYRAMTGLLGFLTENCCQGDEGACGVEPSAAGLCAAGPASGTTAGEPTGARRAANRGTRNA